MRGAHLFVAVRILGRALIANGLVSETDTRAARRRADKKDTDSSSSSRKDGDNDNNNNNTSNGEGRASNNDRSGGREWGLVKRAGQLVLPRRCSCKGQWRAIEPLRVALFPGGSPWRNQLPGEIELVALM